MMPKCPRCTTLSCRAQPEHCQDVGRTAITVLVSSAMLTSAAFALTITRSTFLTSGRIYSTSADFDQAFSQFVTAGDPESIAATREKISQSGFRPAELGIV